MRALKPGMHEYDAQAIGEYVFKRNGAEYVGYPSICGGGENSCILHYESNRRPLAGGDVQLNDMAAEYHGYSADVTRTIPVNGKYSEAQKAIYELVYKAQEVGFAACKPGNDFKAPDKAAKEIIQKGLVDLGIIKDEKDFSTYFMHGTSHYLGLDTHDAGSYGSLKAGNIITVEPGVYIPEGSPCDPKWWNIGVRIEDDILITEKGYENLSASSPRTVEAVEAMMKEKPLLLK
jgi:Xaa-Pro aminopeptidase